MSGNRWNWSAEKFLEEILIRIEKLVAAIFNPTTIEGLLSALYAELQQKANLTEYQPVIITDGVDIANTERSMKSILLRVQNTCSGSRAEQQA